MTQRLTTSRHYQTLPCGQAGQAPEWVHLIPAGTFKGADGRGPYKVADAQKLIDTSLAGRKLVLDENHSTDTAAKQGGQSPARGWIVALDARADGIWGQVDWTDSGKALMADRAYNGISPVFTHTKSGEIVQLLRAALTNDPNLELQCLHSRQENSVDFISSLRKALNMADTADEAALLAAVTAQGVTIAGHAAQIASIATAAGSKAADPAALVTELMAVRAASTETAVMAAKVVGLETQLNTLRADNAKAAATSFVDAAIAAGKPIASLRDHYVARHTADAAAVEKEIGAMVSINAGGLPPFQARNSGDADVDALTTEDMAVCKRMGQDPKEYAKTKKADMERRNAEGGR